MDQLLRPKPFRLEHPAKQCATQLRFLETRGHIDRTVSQPRIDAPEQPAQVLLAEIDVADENHALTIVQQPMHPLNVARHADDKVGLSLQLKPLDLLDLLDGNLWKPQRDLRVDLVEIDLVGVRQLTRLPLGGNPDLEELLHHLEGKPGTRPQLVPHDAEDALRSRGAPRQQRVENIE
ncbi:hypothetical protein [Thiorhodococcus mannitoliphagus]|uniref:hypothetical protein n=1 Tax=Thiorhodococcus mannitoliphagus TaxID=329406 RepID=UPI001F0FDAB3|nr:hypothetical protein [Thiorhodococcus mannitoliphagus]